MNGPHPTKRLLYVLCGLVILFIIIGLLAPDLLGGSQTTVLLAVNVCIFLVCLFDFLLAANPKKISLKRTHPESLQLNKESKISWTLSNRNNKHKVHVQLADHFPPSFNAADRRATIKAKERSETTTSVSIKPERRGRFNLDEIIVRSSGPIGLLQRQATISYPSNIKVIPPFKKAKEARLLIKRSQIKNIGTRTTRRLGGGAEFDSLREMTPDDETRIIDWAATARSQEPIVRTYRAEQNQSLLCVLNTGRTMASVVDESTRFEHMVDASMLLAEVSTSIGDKAGLVAFDSSINTVIAPSTSRSQRIRFSESLFALQPDLSEADYSKAVTYILANYGRRSFLVLLTELNAESINEFLLPVLPLLLRTHLVVVAAISDPVVNKWAEISPKNESEAFRRAAAIQSLNERRNISAILTGIGAKVLDEPSDKFAMKLGDMYLQSKAMGQI